MSRLIDLEGKWFGRLTVLQRGPNLARPRGHAVRWLCGCECGNITLVISHDLRSGHTKSCGCLHKDKVTKHGRSGSVEYRLYLSAKSRAEKNNVSFDISIEDIDIPRVCPVLGIPIENGSRIEQDNSPSLDRFYPELGYTKENVRVISKKANRIKNNASANEVKRVYEWMKEIEQKSHA